MNIISIEPTPNPNSMKINLDEKFDSRISTLLHRKIKPIVRFTCKKFPRCPGRSGDYLENYPKDFRRSQEESVANRNNFG